MSAFEVKECRSCSARIIWTVTHRGRKMPVDAEPVEGGNIRLRLEANRVIAEYPGREHPSLLEDDRKRYVSHFATCEQSDEWRKHE